MLDPEEEKQETEPVRMAEWDRDPETENVTYE